MIEEMKRDQPAEIEKIRAGISGTVEAAFDLLLERREAALAAALSPLDEEEKSLRKEYGEIGAAARNLELLLPAKAREAQRQADALLLEGKQEEAATKIAEAEEARTAPESMKERQGEITERLEAIAGERQVIAKHIFEPWYAELQHVIRAAEHGLFIELLDKAQDAMYAYQTRHELQGTLEDPYGFLIKDFHLSGLTSRERSAEWASSQRWYGDRR